METLPIAKITCYPLEKRDYKPYAQCRICCTLQGDLTVQMWAFEVSPLPQSSLRAVLRLFSRLPESALVAEVFPGGRVLAGVRANGTETLSPAGEIAGVSCLDYNGEDLQGVYWGSKITISRSALERLGGPALLAPGEIFRGNFFKLCPAEPFRHQGCFFPADFSGDYCARQNLGDFLVVEY